MVRFLMVRFWKNKKSLLILLILFFSYIIFVYNFANHSVVLRLGTTSSFENSGLSDYLLDHFVAESGIDLQHLVYGSGQIIELAKRGDLDVIITHAPDLEQKLLEKQQISHRFEFMYNDFILLGHKSDIAGIRYATSIYDALAKIKANEVKFVSRGDNSGTHIKEVYLWKKTGFLPQQLSRKWYIETGLSMGAAINFAQEIKAYILSDSATWHAHKNTTDLIKLYSSDNMFSSENILRNIYAVSIINSSDKYELALKFQKWIVGENAAKLINSFCINNQSVFKTLLYQSSKDDCKR